MHPILRNNIENNWSTLLFIVLLVIICCLKQLNSKKLTGYVFLFSKNNFIEEEIRERTSFFHFFYLLSFIFSTAVFAFIFLTILSEYSVIFNYSFTNFGVFFVFLSIYFILKWSLEYLLSKLFNLNARVLYFLIAKFSYLLSISFVLFVFLIVVSYTSLNASFLMYTSFFIASIRILFMVIYNKKLIFRNLFYFILYICTLEIAPLFILNKLMF